MTIIVIAVVALVAYLKTGHAVIETVQTIAKKAPEIAERFKTGTITRTFVEENVVISPHKTGVLETTTVRSSESFKHEDTRRVLWDTLSLGTTTTEIRVPVTFRYHVQLSDQWRIATRDHICLVLAPSIRPSLPPAIHTDRLERYSDEGWLRSNAKENLQELERGLTAELSQRASDVRHVALAREASRQAIAEFIKTWLLRDAQWAQDRFNAIVVVFPDELPIGSEQELERYQRDPTIQFQQRN